MAVLLDSSIIILLKMDKSVSAPGSLIDGISPELSVFFLYLPKGMFILVAIESIHHVAGLLPCLHSAVPGIMVFFNPLGLLIILSKEDSMVICTSERSGLIRSGIHPFAFLAVHCILKSSALKS